MYEKIILFSKEIFDPNCHRRPTSLKKIKIEIKKINNNELSENLATVLVFPRKKRSVNGNKTTRKVA